MRGEPPLPKWIALTRWGDEVIVLCQVGKVEQWRDQAGRVLRQSILTEAQKWEMGQGMCVLPASAVWRQYRGEMEAYMRGNVVVGVQ